MQKVDIVQPHLEIERRPRQQKWPETIEPRTKRRDQHHERWRPEQKIRKEWTTKRCKVKNPNYGYSPFFGCKPKYLLKIGASWTCQLGLELVVWLSLPQNLRSLPKSILHLSKSELEEFM